MSPAVSIAALIPVIVGVVFWAVGRTMASTRRGWLPTQARVVPSGPDEGGGIFTTLAYYDHTGTAHRCTLRSFARKGVVPLPGGVVRAVYHPDRPDVAQLDTISGGGALFTVLGWLLMGLGVLVGLALLVLALAL